jgi:hypothetical protein
LHARIERLELIKTALKKRKQSFKARASKTFATNLSEAYYDGGWPENNVFRMDHYPYKDGMYIRLLRDDKAMLDRIYNAFRQEVERKAGSNGLVVIPNIKITGPTTSLTFTNVLVEPHNLRTDIFREGTVTAIDAILSLADQDKLSYGLQWYDSIGTADIVRSYWVDRIDHDQSHDRCGFVYEAGSLDFEGFRGNHIHIPSDFRPLNSPEYMEWFWICI